MVKSSKSSVTLEISGVCSCAAVTPEKCFESIKSWFGTSPRMPKKKWMQAVEKKEEKEVARELEESDWGELKKKFGVGGEKNCKKKKDC